MNKIQRTLLATVATAALTGAAWAQGLSNADKEFLEQAAHNGHAEIEASKLAQTKATNPEVKQFATQMVQDHTAADQELSALAQSKNVKVPTEPSVTQKAELKLLQAMDGDRFDRTYAERIGVKAHEDTVKLFQKSATGAKDPEVKAFAQKLLPALQHHLAMAQSLKMATDKKKNP